MAITGRRVNVGTAATLIAEAVDSVKRVRVRVPAGAIQTVELGASGFASGTGFALGAGDSVELVLDDAAIYGRATAAQDVHVLENTSVI